MTFNVRNSLALVHSSTHTGLWKKHVDREIKMKTIPKVLDFFYLVFINNKQL